jgi:hypothetical protein
MQWRSQPWAIGQLPNNFSEAISVAQCQKNLDMCVFEDLSDVILKNRSL